jgi:hypothetical protein
MYDGGKRLRLTTGIPNLDAANADLADKPRMSVKKSAQIRPISVIRVRFLPNLELLA